MKLIISIIIGICMHSLIAMYIDKLRHLHHKGRTNWALVPFTNVYLLGKYAFDIIVGVVLFVVLFFVVDFSVTFFDNTYGFSLFTDNARTILFIVYFVVILGILYYSSLKYNKATKNKDRFSFNSIIYYLKETLWIVILCIAIYLTAMFIVGLGTGVIII